MIEITTYEDMTDDGMQVKRTVALNPNSVLCIDDYGKARVVRWGVDGMCGSFYSPEPYGDLLAKINEALER